MNRFFAYLLIHTQYYYISSGSSELCFPSLQITLNFTPTLSTFTFKQYFTILNNIRYVIFCEHCPRPPKSYNRLKICCHKSMIYLNPIFFHAPAIFARFIFAPLIFAHLPNSYFRALFIFAQLQ